MMALRVGKVIRARLRGWMECWILNHSGITVQGLLNNGAHDYAKGGTFPSEIVTADRQAALRVMRQELRTMSVMGCIHCERARGPHRARYRAIRRPKADQ
ncbi:MAG: hypothetical protein V3S01_05595 [Dehalococcoidia bacterium]